MNPAIRKVTPSDIETILQIARKAWAPVWISLKTLLGPEIWKRLNEDHQGSQLAAIEDLCRDESEETAVWVAEDPERATGPVGFVAYKLNTETCQGEIWFLAVDPDHQNADIGTALNRHALDQMREAGMRVAIVETGGDPSHAPARRAYEKAGFTLLPIARYFQAL